MSQELHILYFILTTHLLIYRSRFYKSGNWDLENIVCSQSAHFSQQSWDSNKDPNKLNLMLFSLQYSAFKFSQKTKGLSHFGECP